MRSGINYDNALTQCPTAETSTDRLLCTIAAARGWLIEHLDIQNDQVYEPLMYGKDIYIKELPRSNGEFVHGNSCDKLV